MLVAGPVQLWELLALCLSRSRLQVTSCVISRLLDPRSGRLGPPMSEPRCETPGRALSQQTRGMTFDE